MDPKERAHRYIAKCPPAISGAGGHNAAYYVAVSLVHGFALSDADALQLMREWNQFCLPPWSEAELVHKVRSAVGAQLPKSLGYLLGTGSGKSATRGSAITAKGSAIEVRKPTFCPVSLKRVAAKMEGLADIFSFVCGASPVPVLGQDSNSVLRLLYPERSGEKVLIFSDLKSQGQKLWEARRENENENRLPSGQDGTWFLPQPVDGKFHPNPRHGNKLSRRSEESITCWRYAVVESDQANLDEWLRCLVQMPLRITSICESGGRSIHALVQVDAESKRDWDDKIRGIKWVLVTLGADPTALSAIRLTRLPQAKRGDRVQRLLYLNLHPNGTPIFDQVLSRQGPQ